MSGTDVPYHLRVNKFIERGLFIELLSWIESGLPSGDISRYVYASLSGKFMDDLKLVHHEFGVKKLYSIEQDNIIYGRQRFNKPLSWIECVHQSSADFVDRFDVFIEELDHPNSIIWLDFAAANKRGAQLTEFEALVAKLADYDIVKITLNANVKSLFSRPLEDEEGEQVQTRTIERARSDALQRLKEQLGEYMPPGVQAGDMRNAVFPKILSNATRIAALKAMTARHRSKIVPLAINSYSDGHLMLCLTAIVLPKLAEPDFWAATHIKEWEFFSPDWDTVHVIAVPDLSLREKMEIDLHYGKNPVEKVHRDLPFKLDKEHSRSLNALRSYVKHQWRYPSFGRYWT